MTLKRPVVELQYLDETGSRGTTSVTFPLDTTYAVLDAQATALASFIAPLTGCTLIRQRIIIKDVTEPKPTPDVGSSITRCGVFIFSDASDENVVLVQVPGILNDVLVDDGPGAGVLIDTDDSRVTDFVVAYIASIMVNPFNVECSDLDAAYRQSRV